MAVGVIAVMLALVAPPSARAAGQADAQSAVLEASMPQRRLEPVVENSGPKARAALGPPDNVGAAGASMEPT